MIRRQDGNLRKGLPRAICRRLVSSGLAAALACVVALVPPFSTAASRGNGPAIAGKRVIHYEDSTADVLQAIQNAARRLEIPIGTELKGLLRAQGVSIKVSDGTAADVLNAIMEHAPDYKWIEENSVIDIMPKENGDSVLNLNIGHFKVHDATPSHIHEVVVSLPEVKAWMSRNQVVERSLIAGSILIGSNGKTDEPRLSLERRNATLREIMNSLIVKTKKAGPGNWFFSRYGDSSEYLNIGID